MVKERPTEENPVFKERKKDGNFFYMKEWYDEDGKRRRQKATDLEYYNYLKAQKANSETVDEIKEAAEEKIEEKIEEIPEEEAKEVKKAKKEPPINTEDLPAVSQDGEITEVIGKISSIKVHEEEEEGGTTRNSLTLNITAKDGTKFKNVIARAKGVRQLMLHILNRETISTLNDTYGHIYSFIIHGNSEEVQKEINKGLKDTPTFLFRIDRTDDGDFTFAIVTPRWKKIKIQDLESSIIEAFQDVDGAAIVTKEDTSGRHGGSSTVRIPGLSDIFDLIFYIDAGELDGFHAARVSAGCQILSCMNELTFPEYQIPGLQNQVSVRHKKVHSGSIDDFKDAIKDIFELCKVEVETMVTSAKDSLITIKKMEEILIYFIAMKKLSKNDVEILKTYIRDDKITQVPNTMYGLAMAISYHGSHGEKLSDHKRKTVSTVAGEIFIVSSEKDTYMKIIAEPVAEWRAEEKKKEEERAEKAKKAEQAKEQTK